jgi:hypothetical protein
VRAYVKRHHVGLIALMVAVIGLPTAWALGRNSVGSKELKPNAVKGSEIADGAVKSPEVTDGSLLGKDFAAGQLPAGPQGPAGSVPPGPPASEVVGPVNAFADGVAVKLTSVQFTGSEPRRVLLAGGFNAICNPCLTSLTPSWQIRLGGGGTLVTRRLSSIATESTGASVGEVIVTPGNCQPCTFELWTVVTPLSPGSTLNVTGIRMGIVDLGAVGA